MAEHITQGRMEQVDLLCDDCGCEMRVSGRYVITKEPCKYSCVTCGASINTTVIYPFTRFVADPKQ